MLTPAIVFALSLQAAPAAQSAASLAGCITDDAGQRLPGVTIAATADRVRRTATAGSDGCYELPDLPPGSYRVTARLAGFDNVIRDGATIAPAAITKIDATLRVSTICECVREGGETLTDQWAFAEAVLHVRLSASEQGARTPTGYYRHAATVLNALKRPAGPTEASVFVLQNQRSAHQSLTTLARSLSSS